MTRPAPIEALQHDWRDYRRGLQMSEQVLYDRLWQRAHRLARRLEPRDYEMNEVFLLILADQQRELADLRESANITSLQSTDARAHHLL